MQTILAKQGQRLDQIFFLVYGADKALDPIQFYPFLQANRALLKTPILLGGEVVNLPDFPSTTGRIVKSPLYWD